jgi:hypothetical protein
MAQEAYTWTGDSEVWLKIPIHGHRGLRAKECAYINDNATDAHQRKTHTHKKKMGCQKMTRPENQALLKKIIAQRKSSANKLDDKDNGRRSTMQNKPRKSIKDQGERNKLTMKV